MNSSRFSWGMVIIVLGGLLLAANFGYIGEIFWSNLWKFWPAILIIWGVAVLFSQKGKSGNKIGVLVSLIIVITIIALALWQSQKSNNEQIGTTSISESSIKDNIELSIKFGASELKLDGNGYQALSGEVKSYENVQLNRQEVADTTKISLNQTASHPGYWIGKREKTLFDLSLAQMPSYQVKIDTGASKFDLDFEKVKLKELKINSGASSGNIKLSDMLNLSKVHISSGASSFNIYIPKNVAIKITNDSGLSSVDVNDLGLNRNDKEYVSKDYDLQERKIEIQLSTGASSIKFSEY